MSRDDLIVVTSYYNPEHYQRRKDNYTFFRNWLKYQDVPCITVECVLGDDLPELEPGPDMITVRTRDSLWQKERLLNIAIDNAPSKYTKIAWLDCDVIFTDPEWVDKSSDLLDQYKIIQPFNRVVFLHPDGPDTPGSRDYKSSFAMIKKVYNPERHGHAGFAWAAQRDLLARHHLYDAAIIGHGDHLIAHAIYGDFNVPCLNPHIPTQEFREHFYSWGLPFFKDVNGETTSLQGVAQHLWHGELKNRNYQNRHSKLREFSFNPSTDIEINSQGAWEWVYPKRELHRWVSGYFKGRREDG